MIDPPNQPPPGDSKRHRFPRALRLSGSRAFAAVYESELRRHAGPLIVHALPNGLGVTRIGFSVSRRVGAAVVRNRIKRRLREAFRLSQHDLPSGYDVAARVRPHEPLDVESYRGLLLSAIQALDERCRKSQGQSSEMDAH